MDIGIPKAVGDKVVRLDDDIVALVSLDLHERGLFDCGGFPKWRAHLQASELYDSHWLLAYEAWEHGWLVSASAKDYIADDEFFSILRNHGVRFYGGAIALTSSYFGY